MSGILLIFEIRNLNKSQVKENNLSVDSDEEIAADKKQTMLLLLFQENMAQVEDMLVNL